MASASARLLLASVLLVGLLAAAQAGSLGRSLSACHYDNCGIWCGPPRPPPCGSAAPPARCAGAGSSTTASGSWGKNQNNQDCYCSNGYWEQCKNPNCYSSSSWTENNKWGMNDSGEECKCSNGQWTNCKAKSCYANGATISDGSWAVNDNGNECKCSDGQWTQCKPKACFGNGQWTEHNKWGWTDAGTECKCQDGMWDQCKSSKCFANSVWTESGSWGITDSQDECLCDNGSWKDCKEPEGCIGNLPFGLENCVCDGAGVGEMAGLAACGRVVSECLPPVAAFSVSGDGPLESVQQICDTFALDACISAAQMAPVVNNGCGDLLRLGTGLCTPSQAMQIFMDSVNLSCDPLCKDCIRL